MACRGQASSRLDLHVPIPNVILMPVVTVIIVTAVVQHPPGCKKPGILSEAQRVSFLRQFWRSGGPTWGFLAPIPS